MGILNGLLGPRLEPKRNNISYTLFESYAKVFGTHCAESPEMINAVELWNRNYQRCSTQLMKLISKEAAKLTLTDFTINIEPTAQTELFERFAKITKEFEVDLQRYIEQGIALGGLILKPSETGIIFVSPLNFVVTAYNNKGNISEIIFIEHAIRGNMYYTKLEYHHWNADGNYAIDTACFKAKERYSLGYHCELLEVPEWSTITPTVIIEGLESPLYTYFRMPGANNIDETSNYGLSLCSSAMEYIGSFDNTYRLFKKDLELSQKKVFVTDTAMFSVDGNNKNGKSFTHNPLPDLMIGIMGGKDNVQIFDPKSAVEDYKTALQLELNMIATACGFTAGYFTFDNGTVAVTATQVESEDQETVSTIVAIRKALNMAIERALAQQAALLMLYNEGIVGYELTLYARDLSATPNADRERTIDLVKNGLYPLSLYLKEYEGLSDAEIESFLQEKNKSVETQ